MNNAKQLAYALIDALNACGIEEEFSYRFLAEMNDILRKENKELELENESKMVAGHNEEFQQQIIMLMKEYGLTAIEALELVDKLSKPKVKITADLTNNISGDIADVMQDVYTSGEDNKDKLPFHEDLIARLHRRLDCKMNKEDLLLYRSISQTIKAAKEVKEERDKMKRNLEGLASISKGLCDGSIEHIQYDPEENDNTKEHDDILNALIKLSGVGTTDEELAALNARVYGTFADPKNIFSSGEDPGDTHEPSKGSGTPNYGRILDQLDWALDCKESVRHYRLYNEIKGILKEHQAQNKPVEPLQGSEKIIPLTPSVYADGAKPVLEIDTTHEGRAYQAMQFKDFVITFMQGDECIKSTDIHEALKYAYLLCEGYMAHINKRRYRMKEILMKQYPSHEVIVKVEEVKGYE
jgi:hypothetical protein